MSYCIILEVHLLHIVFQNWAEPLAYATGREQLCWFSSALLSDSLHYGFICKHDWRDTFVDLIWIDPPGPPHSSIPGSFQLQVETLINQVKIRWDNDTLLQINLLLLYLPGSSCRGVIPPLCQAAIIKGIRRLSSPSPCSPCRRTGASLLVYLPLSGSDDRG